MQACFAVGYFPGPAEAPCGRILETVVEIAPDAGIDEELVGQLAAILADERMRIAAEGVLQMRRRERFALPFVAAGDLMADAVAAIEAIACLIAAIVAVAVVPGPSEPADVVTVDVEAGDARLLRKVAVEGKMRETERA
ncbi:hypothetical protein D3C72_2057820 [compost metagenome]